MAGSARFTAILDACVLYPQLGRDVLMRLTFAGLYHARWSVAIEEEWTRIYWTDGTGSAVHPLRGGDKTQGRVPRGERLRTCERS